LTNLTLHFILEAVQCSIPEDPVNGRALYTSVSYDSIVRYECRYGYKLHGLSNRTCSSNKQWSGESPKCEGMNDSLILIQLISLNIQYEFNYEWKRTHLFHFDTTNLFSY
jgi:hypothetical protein